jgi:hypothetical protein
VWSGGSKRAIRSREAPGLARLYERAQGRRRSAGRTPHTLGAARPRRPTGRPQAIRDLRTPRSFR